MSNLDKIVRLLLKELEERLKKSPQINRISMMYSVFKSVDRKWQELMWEEKLKRRKELNNKKGGVM